MLQRERPQENLMSLIAVKDVIEDSARRASREGDVRGRKRVERVDRSGRFHEALVE